MNIEIIATCNNTLKETGFGSKASCIDVLDSIKRTAHSVKLTICQTPADLNAVVKRNPDFVFLAAKYLPIENGEDIWFSDFFSKNNITFSGSNRETLKYDSDKVSAKIHLNSKGIDTARYFTAIPNQFHSQNNLPLPFPLFIKPSDAANSNGVDESSFVSTFDEFEAKVLSIHTLFGQPALIEEYLSGREFTVAIICEKNGKLTTSSIEILPPTSDSGLRILGDKVKKEDTESLVEINNPDDIACVSQLAEAAFLELGVRGFGRIDVKMNHEGQCFFMEANLVPGMTRGSSYFPKACEISNQLTYDEVIHLMLDECSDRALSDKAMNQTSQQGNSPEEVRPAVG